MSDLYIIACSNCNGAGGCFSCSECTKCAAITAVECGEGECWKCRPLTKKGREQMSLYILYDESAKSGDTDESTVLVSCTTLNQVKRFLVDWPNAAVFEYDIEYDYDTETGAAIGKGQLVNERRREDLEMRARQRARYRK